MSPPSKSEGRRCGNDSDVASPADAGALCEQG